MAARALIDTGAILAVLDRGDNWHRLCTETLEQLRVPLLTSEAVLAELFYLIRVRRFDPNKTWSFLLDAVEVAAIDNSELPHLRALMARYADRPMDFADATLVYLARRESIRTILTVDHSDFSIYQIEPNCPFHILPTGRP